MFICGESYVIPFLSKGFEVKQVKPVTHTRPMSDPSCLFLFYKLLGTQNFTSSQGIQVSFDELSGGAMEQEASAL